MDFSRINRTHVWIVGAVVILASCGIIFGVFIMNMMQTQTIALAYQKAVDDKAATLPSVTADTKKAQDNLTADKALHVQFLVRNPQFFVDTGQTPAAAEERLWALRQLELELRGDRGNDGRTKVLLERAFSRRMPGLNADAKFNGIPAPDNLPSRAFKSSPLVFPSAGQVQVRGTYAAIEHYLMSLARLPRICTLGAVSLDSYAASSATNHTDQDMVHASFPVNVYVFIQGVSEVGSGGGGGAPGMGGYPGGGSSGYPGGGGGGYPGGAPSGYPGGAPKTGPPAGK